MFEGSGYIMSSNKSLTSKQRREQRREQRNAKRVKMLEEIQHIVDGFAYDISSRTVPLESAVIHAGPTNSGKTHHAIKAMIETYEKHGDSKGVIAYGGPLRLLAAETYTKLCEQLGEDNVGLITGDHEINPTAPVLACTVECLPERGHLVVIDEAHWAGDIDRGSAWTRALLGYHYEHMIVLSPIEMCDILTECVSDAATITVHHHERYHVLWILRTEPIITTRDNASDPSLLQNNNDPHKPLKNEGQAFLKLLTHTSFLFKERYFKGILTGDTTFKRFPS